MSVIYAGAKNIAKLLDFCAKNAQNHKLLCLTLLDATKYGRLRCRDINVDK